ncbi:MAG: hypothetical protein AB7V50_01295 [Vampirovibrionia bacterium]
MFKPAYFIVVIFLCLYLVVVGKSYADEVFYPIGSTPLVNAPPFAGQTFYPTGEPFTNRYGIKFWLYNDKSGRVDLNLVFLQKNKWYISPAVVSPDFNQMLYTQVFYYPDANEVVSKCFYVPVVLPTDTGNNENVKIQDYYKSYQVRASQQNRYEILNVTSKIRRDNVFKTLTIVDWAYDSNRVLIKQHVGRMAKGILGTIVWVYEVNDDKLYRIDTVRKAIVSYWKEKQNLDLNQHIWDINVLGWEQDSNTRFVVNAYIYPYKNVKKFLGCWSVDINGNMSQLLSLDNENWNVGSYGLVPEL